MIDQSAVKHFRSYSLNGELNYWIIADHRWKFTPKPSMSPSGHRPVNQLDLEDMRWLVQHGAPWQRMFE